MTVKVNNNVLTVVTDITKEVVEAGLSNLKAKDEKGNEVYGASLSKDGKASINAFSFVGNTYIEGKLAATIILPMETTEADVQKQYGESLLKAKKYTTQIATEAQAKHAEIARLFA